MGLINLFLFLEVDIFYSDEQCYIPVVATSILFFFLFFFLSFWVVKVAGILYLDTPFSLSLKGFLTCRFFSVQS